MPLIDPVTMSKGGSGQNDWMSKLIGKKLGDTNDQISFAKKDLPENHRVVEEGSMNTMDHKPDRMNVHVDKEGIVKQIKWG